jgi:hypothetical protein
VNIIKRCQYHHPKNAQHTGHTFIPLNSAYWKPSCGIIAGFSWIIFKKHKSKAARNIGAAVRNTIPGIGTGNPITISNERLCCKQALDDFAVKDILFEHLGRNLD